MAVITRYIDFNRGSDSNDGATKQTAWKNITKLHNLNVSGGSNIYLEKSSVWEINPTRLASNRIVLDAVQGTENAPIYIGGYDYGEPTTSKPTIKYRMFPVSSDWTWDASLLSWYIQFTPAYIDADSLIKIGDTWVPSSNQGSQGINSTLNGVTSESLRSYIDVSTRRVYLAYASDSPLVTPEEHFGAGQIMLGLNAAFISFYFMPYVEIDGLRVEDGGRLLNLSMGDAGRVALGFSMHNCESYNTTGLIGINTSGIGSQGLGEVDIYDNLCINMGAPAIKTFGDRVVGKIRNNTLINGNLNTSFAGAIYLQADCPYDNPLIVSDNFADNILNGVGTSTFDGCAYYAELGSDGVVITRNVAKNCFKAFQINSGYKCTIIGNVAYECDMFASVTDADNVGQADYIVANNLLYNTTLNRFRYGSQATPVAAITAWSTTPNNLIRSEISNNIFTGIGVSDKPAIFAYRDVEWASGKVIVKNNYVSGFNDVKTKTEDLTDKTSVCNFVSGNPSFIDPENKNFRLSAFSDLFGVGIDVSTNKATDADGVYFNSPPSVGAYEQVRQHDYLGKVRKAI